MGSDSCECTTATFIANTGILTLYDANPNLNGLGAKTLLVGAENGTTVNNLIIKCTQPSLTGMVRLFIQSIDNREITLYREIPLPIYPQTTYTPTPIPIWPMLEINLSLDLTLENSTKLLASSQNGGNINVIAEGIDWRSLTATPPAKCCVNKNVFGKIGNKIISLPNPNLDGTGTIYPIYQAGLRGSNIQSITISALQSTLNGMVRFFISSDGDTWTLMFEVAIPQTNQSAFTPSFKTVLNDVFKLQSDYYLGASTQNAESFAITVIGEDWNYIV